MGFSFTVIFTAIDKIAPLTGVTVEDANKGKSVLDVMIEKLAAILVNDALTFTGLAQQGLAIENGDAVFPRFDYREEQARKVNTAIAINQSELSDEMRDELSGKGVTPSAGDNDCQGGSCSI